MSKSYDETTTNIIGFWLSGIDFTYFVIYGYTRYFLQEEASSWEKDLNI